MKRLKINCLAQSARSCSIQKRGFFRSFILTHTHLWWFPRGIPQSHVHPRLDDARALYPGYLVGVLIIHVHTHVFLIVSTHILIVYNAIYAW